MKKSGREFAEEMVDCIRINDLSREESIQYLRDMLRDIERCLIAELQEKCSARALDDTEDMRHVVNVVKRNVRGNLYQATWSSKSKKSSPAKVVGGA